MAEHSIITADQACAELTTLGVECSAESIHPRQRGDRWSVTLPGHRMAWLATSHAAIASLARERRVLRLLEARCRFAVPRILSESRDGSVDVREMVAGTHDAAGLYGRLQQEPEAGRSIGVALAEMLVEQHTLIREDDVASWLPHRPEWPESREWIMSRLPGVVDDPELHYHVARVLDAVEQEEETVSPADCVLVHTDLGLHNVSIDRDSLHVHGVFDWESACWADRHFDFRLLVGDAALAPLLETLVATYERATSIRLSRHRLYLYNAAIAVTYLAFRLGIAPEQSWCGRTLAEDLAWTRHAIASALRERGNL